jgi:hypothetical protein
MYGFQYLPANLKLENLYLQRFSSNQGGRTTDLRLRASLSVSVASACSSGLPPGKFCNVA